MLVTNYTDEPLWAYGFGTTPPRRGETVHIPPYTTKDVSCPPPVDPIFRGALACQSTLEDEMGYQVLPGSPLVYGTGNCGVIVYCDEKDCINIDERNIRGKKA